jgi:hypothetical protein
MFKVTTLSLSPHPEMPVATYLDHNFLVNGSSCSDPQYWKARSPDLNHLWDTGNTLCTSKTGNIVLRHHILDAATFKKDNSDEHKRTMHVICNIFQDDY